MVRLKTLSVILLLCAVFYGFKHPYHVSVSSFTYSAKENAISWSLKVFYHDLEPSIIKACGKSFDIKNHEPVKERDSLVHVYLKTNYCAVLNNDTLDLSEAGIRFKDEYIFIEKKIKLGERKPKALNVYNTICFNTETTQVQLYHWIVNGVKQTKKIYYPKNEVVYTF